MILLTKNAFSIHINEFITNETKLLELTGNKITKIFTINEIKKMLLLL